MVVFALSMGRAKHYRYAVEHLRSCEQLQARIDDWQGVEPHTSFMGRLRKPLRSNRASGSCWSADQP